MPNGPDTGGHPAKRTRGGGRRSSTSAKTRPRTVALASEKTNENKSENVSSPPAKPNDSLLSAICHDLRAPLAAVTMGANFVLQTTKRDDANARSVRILEAMLRSCTQMERLIRNFADLSEIEAHSVALRTGIHDAGEMLELAAQAARDAASARSVSLEVVKPDPPVALHADRERILRAIVHVVENAVKHAPEGSKVTLSAALRGESVCFAVVDHGHGLAPDVRENLFDRQWHARRTNRDGAGFGIAIARGFLMAHGGTLEVASEPDVETTFTLCLPKDRPQAE